jgi:prepilin-type N-terminal cleavage/methylation domain-containing protein
MSNAPAHATSGRLQEQFMCEDRINNARCGFTFTEILFALMILGIGFIMVAAMFPVAIRQTQLTVQETTGASVAKSGASYVARLASKFYTPANPTTSTPAYNTTYFPPTNGTVLNDVVPNSNNGGIYGTAITPAIPPAPAAFTANTSLWGMLMGNLILPTDQRYAFVPFYSRLNVPSATVGVAGANYAQVTVIAVQCRNFASYTPADLRSYNGYGPNLRGRPLIATFTAGGNGPDTIYFQADSAAGTRFVPNPDPVDYTGAVGEGSYVIVADDQFTANHLPSNSGQPPVTCNGYVYRVGNPLVQPNGTRTLNTWELTPGNDMKSCLYAPATTYSSTPAPIHPVAPIPAGTASAQVRVFIVGRGYTDPTVNSPGNLFAGPVMDIGAFSTFVKIQQ